jgi:hypothetical protein
VPYLLTDDDRCNVTKGELKTCGVYQMDISEKAPLDFQILNIIKILKAFKNFTAIRIEKYIILHTFSSNSTNVAAPNFFSAVIQTMFTAMHLG